jgi:hypothetical protein
MAVYGIGFATIIHEAVTCYPRIISFPFNPKQQQLEKHGFGIEKGKSLPSKCRTPPQKKG